MSLCTFLMIGLTDLRVTTIIRLILLIFFLLLRLPLLFLFAGKVCHQLQELPCNTTSHRIRTPVPAQSSHISSSPNVHTQEQIRNRETESRSLGQERSLSRRPEGWFPWCSRTNCRVPRNQHCHHAPCSFNAEAKRSNIKKKQVLNLLVPLAAQNSSLHYSTVCHSLVGVNALAKLFPVEEILQQLLHFWDLGGSTNDDNVVDVTLVDLGVPQTLREDCSGDGSEGDGDSMLRCSPLRKLVLPSARLSSNASVGWWWNSCSLFSLPPRNPRTPHAPSAASCCTHPTPCSLNRNYSCNFPLPADGFPVCCSH